MRGNETPNPMWTKFCRMVGISNIGTYTNFDDDRLRGFGVVGSIFFLIQAFDVVLLQYCAREVAN